MSSHEPLWSLRHSSAGRSVRLSVSVGVSGSRSVSLSLSLGRSEPWPVVPSFFLLLLSSCCWFGFPCLVAAENSTAFGIHQRMKKVPSPSNFIPWYSAKPASGCRPSRLFVCTDVCVCVCVCVSDYDQFLVLSWLEWESASPCRVFYGQFGKSCPVAYFLDVVQ